MSERVHYHTKWEVLISVFLFFLSACGPTKKIALTAEVKAIKFINVYEFPQALRFSETTVGGLSGIDYDRKKGVYYIICDDPSSKGPTRFYTAKINISAAGIDSVSIIAVTSLKDKNGNTYPDITKDRIHSADVEAMRYDVKRNEFIWSSEGQRVLLADTSLLQDPAIVIMNKSGYYKDSFALPTNMHILPVEKGLRHNDVFEGLTFDEHFRHVFVSVEAPLYEDGLPAAGGDTTGWSRIIKFDRVTRKPIAQYAYQLDPVPYPSNPPGAFKINGIPDILYAGDNKLIVIERGYSTGRLPSDIRVYLADMDGAEDVSDKELKTYAVKKPLQKKLLVDMNTLGIYVDNIEGVTFGPRLPNGNYTLVFVSDDNFDQKQRTQFILFEILP